MLTNNSEKAVSVIRAVALIFAVAASAGCATVLKGSHQSIAVSTDPSSADVLVDGTMVGQTAMSIQMKRKTDHLVTIQKAGFQP